jgi:hypothetical protein
LLKSLSVDSTPNIPELIRFALLSLLNSLKSLLLTYPINVVLLLLLVLAFVHRITSTFKKDKKFKAVYVPLQHHDSNIE